MHGAQLKLIRKPIENIAEFESFLSVIWIINQSPPQKQSSAEPETRQGNRAGGLGLAGEHSHLWMYVWENESSPLLIPHPKRN